MRTQRTTKGNRDAGSSCSCDRGLHRYLRNFGWAPPTRNSEDIEGGWGVQTPRLNTPTPPRYATAQQ